MQQYSGTGVVESAAGRELSEASFVTKALPDIKKKLDKTEDWSGKDLSELLREAQKVCVRRDEEKKLKSKTKLVVAGADEVIKGQPGNGLGRGRGVAERSLQPPVRRPQGQGWGMSPWQTGPSKCFCCGTLWDTSKEKAHHCRGRVKPSSADAALPLLLSPAFWGSRLQLFSCLAQAVKLLVKLWPSAAAFE